jgi:outer membrane protein OmpA-like peptidoglycan-associated protein
MKKVTLLLLLFSCICLAQEVKKKKEEKFTKTEMLSFLKVYKYKLDHPFEPLESAQNNASKIKINQERLNEIFQSQFGNNDAKVTKEEQKELDVLKILVENDKKIFDENLQSVIIENNLTVEKYKKIKFEYNNNDKFQRKVNKLSNNKK